MPVTLSSGVIISGLTAYDANANNAGAGYVTPGDEIAIDLTATASNPGAVFYDEITAIAYGTGGIVLPITFPAQAIAVGLPVLSSGESISVHLVSTTGVPDSAAGESITIVAGSYADLSIYTPGSNFSYEAPELVATLQATSTAGTGSSGGTVSPPVTTPTGTAALAITGATATPSPVRVGQSVRVLVTVANQGTASAAGSLDGVDSLGRAWGPIGTPSIAPGDTATIPMLSSPTPASAIGKNLVISIGGSGVTGEATVSVPVVSTSGTTTTPPVSSPPSTSPSFPWADVAIGGLGLGGLIGLAAAISAGRRR